MDGVREGEAGGVSSFITALQHNIGYIVPGGTERGGKGKEGEEEEGRKRVQGEKEEKGVGGEN